ncbi:MAG: outer membrane protein assembly factor BamA [Rhizobiales bacterium]|nr:outer membrane protein assembly factor BamA [Hyphomicrobiales bacterium]
MSYRFVSVGRLALALSLGLPLAVASTTVRPAYAQVVSRIIVEGNQRVEAETVQSYMQVTPGERASADAIDESIKSLFQTGLFSDVRISQRGSALVVYVEENPLINLVRFEGNSEIKDKTLTAEVQLRDRQIFTRAKAQSDVERLIALYRRSGYFAARVEPKIIKLSQNRVNLVYEIVEGSSTKIRSITFAGNKAFSDGQLRSVVTTSESSWWNFFSRTDNYDPDRLNFDRELLRRHYLKHGFADFQVISANAELARDGESFFITFTVDEGPQYSVNSITVNTGQTSLDPDKLAGVITLQDGQIYDASKVDKSIEKMTIEAGKAGFAFARVEPNIVRDEVNRKLDVSFELTEGPRVYIERIDIVGNTRTLDKVIRRELRLVEGDAYNRILIERSRRRLTGLDFFEKIDFREKPGSAPDKLVLEIYVEEKSTGTINFSAGYSTVEQVIGSVNVTERNLLGRGQEVRLGTALSFKRQSVDFSFTEPYFLDRNVSFGVDAFATRTDQDNESSFTIQQVGGGFRLGLPLSEYSQVRTRYRFTYRDINVDNTSVSPAIAKTDGEQMVSLVGATFIHDMIDNPRKPTSGYRFELTEEVAGVGGDVFYLKSEAAGYYFTPLFYDGVILKLKAKAGHMEGWNGKNVPVVDRFFIGADTFRGFARSGVGPKQQRTGAPGVFDSIGGQTYAVGTVEVIFPLGLPDGFGIEGAVFSDVGTVFNAPENSRVGAPVFDSAELRASVGAGVLWQSPFGPLRLDVAYPVLKAKTDEKELLRFSVGTRF